MPFTYERGTHRYRDAETGRFVSRVRIERLLSQSIAAAEDASMQLAQMAATGQIDATVWRNQMREQIKREYVRQYLLGRGGREQMTQRDWGIVGHMLRDQYQYLERFAGQISNGAYAEAENAIHLRAGLYFKSARQAFNRAETESRGLPPLPQVPADGKTACMTNCRCTLDFQRSAAGWLIFWRLNPQAEHCEDCVTLAANWNPLRYEHGQFIGLSQAITHHHTIDETRMRDLIAYALAQGRDRIVVRAEDLTHEGL